MNVERSDVHLEDEEYEVDGKSDITNFRVVRGDATFHQALLKEPPRPWSPRSLILYACAIVGFFCSTANGLDGSLFNNLLINPEFKSYYNVSESGAWAGIVTSMYAIGSVVAIPFIGPAIDNWGRKVGMYIGALAIIIGVVIQSTTKPVHPIAQFMGGRFFLGWGVGIIAAAGPVYVVETAHPAHRGVVGAFYNTFWFVGALVAAGASRGSLELSGNVAWIVPVWLQLMFPGLIVLLVWLLPESPRWLYVNNQRDKAKAMLAGYHGEGNPNSVWVEMQLREYETYLELDGADKRWWDYRALWKNSAARYRLACTCVISIFGQWAGNGAISYFIGAVLTTAGITSAPAQSNINLGLICTQLAFAIIGAALVDKIGRRPILLFTNIGISLVWIAVTIASFEYPRTDSAASSIAVIAMIFLFDAVYSVGFTPLQALYPVECLSFTMRAKGIAFSNFATSAAGLVNQFAYPIALKERGWKTYLLFTLWCPIQALVIYFFIPETRERTLEELDDIFNAKNPRKFSTQKKKIAMDDQSNIINIESL